MYNIYIYIFNMRHICIWPVYTIFMYGMYPPLHTKFENDEDLCYESIDSKDNCCGGSEHNF